jgi:hypothetical protein
MLSQPSSNVKEVNLTRIGILVIMLKTEIAQAENGTSRLPARFREPGKVRAGTSAGVEWTRELQAEGVSPVGYDGKGTVSQAQGIVLLHKDCTLKRCPDCIGAIRVAPRRK